MSRPRTLVLATGLLALVVAALPRAASPQGAPVQDLNTDPAKVLSGDYVATREHGRVVWSVSHLGFSNYAGLLTDVTARLKLDAQAPTNSRLDAEVRLNSVLTGLPAFDDRLRGETILNTARFPLAEFHSTRLVRTARNKARATGNLTFMGVTRPAVLEATFNQSGIGPGKAYRVGFDGRMMFRRSEWGMASPAGVGDMVTLTIEADFVKPKP